MDSARCGGPDEKIPLAPGTNQIAGFVEFRPLMSWEKDRLRYLQAGRLQQFVPAWKDITDDPEVLDWVEHYHLQLIDSVPMVQQTDHKIIQFSVAESAIIDSEVVKLLNKGVIVESTHSQREFVSSIFLRLKKNGVDYMMILDLEELIEFIVYWHFKMDSLKTVTDLKLKLL